MNKKQYKAFKAWMVGQGLWSASLTVATATIYFNHFKDGCCNGIY